MIDSNSWRLSRLWRWRRRRRYSVQFNPTIICINWYWIILIVWRRIESICIGSPCHRYVISICIVVLWICLRRWRDRNRYACLDRIDNFMLFVSFAPATWQWMRMAMCEQHIFKYLMCTVLPLVRRLSDLFWQSDGWKNTNRNHPNKHRSGVLYVLYYL